MQKNALSYSLLLFLIVIGVFSMLSLMPELTVADFTLKKINLLADIQPDPPDTIPKKKVKKETSRKSKKKVSKVIPCKPGMTCLEDYSKDKRALRSFISALYQTHKKPIRIAFFGDSFVEGDILSASLRDTLQFVYGGSGVGYVPIASEVAQFRTSIQHTFSNWATFSIVGKKSDWSPPCPSGFCFVPLENNMVEYRAAKKKKPVPFKNVRLFYTNTIKAGLDYTVNDTVHRSIKLATSKQLRETKLSEDSIQSIRLKFTNSDSLKVYGISFEERTGLYVDNFAMRGNSGLSLQQISSDMNTQFNAFQDYKLIILQYGLNVVTENDTLGYNWYITKMVKMVNRLKKDFPGSSLLLISVSDRSTNQDGTFKTIPFIPMMRDAQREIAQTCEIAFWDLYAAMGGENSMLKYVNAVPPMAAKDYTHLTYRGGRKIAKQLADAILFEQERHGKKTRP